MGNWTWQPSLGVKHGGFRRQKLHRGRSGSFRKQHRGYIQATLLDIARILGMFISLIRRLRQGQPSAMVASWRFRSECDQPPGPSLAGHLHLCMWRGAAGEACGGCQQAQHLAEKGRDGGAHGKIGMVGCDLIELQHIEHVIGEYK